MLDTWLKVAYDHTREEKAEADLFATMKQLPMEELHKLAMGGMCSSDRGPDWLDHFKGTPLFEQAIGLEQEDIQLEMARKQQSDQDRSMWDMRDQLQMKKRLLDIQLAQFEQQQLTGQPAAPPGGGGAPPGAPPAPEVAPPGGAPPGGPPGGGGGAGAIDPATGTPKSVTVKMGMPSPAAAMAFMLGAHKGQQHSDEALAGGLRGGGGFMLGAPVGRMLGEGAGNILTGLAGGDERARAAGGEVGGVLGGYGGGIAGYKLLTHKYDGAPHRDTEPVKQEEPKEASADILEAVAWARALAQADREKIADAVALLETSVAMGQALAKTGAFDAGALLQHAKTIGTGAVAAARAHPQLAATVAGGVLGAGAGAVAGGPDHRLAGAAGGAATGAGLAHAGTGVLSRMAGTPHIEGSSAGNAIRSYATEMAHNIRGAVSRQTPPPTAPAAPQLMA